MLKISIFLFFSALTLPTPVYSTYFDKNLYQSQTSKNTIFFLEITNGLGYVAHGDFEKALDNGKMFFKPSYLVELGHLNIYKKLGLSFGTSGMSIKPFNWWNNKYHEKNFKLINREIHLGFSLSANSDKSTFLTVGKRNIVIKPPIFNDKGLIPQEIQFQQDKFQRDEEVWKGVNKSGIEIGFLKYKSWLKVKKVESDRYSNDYKIEEEEKKYDKIHAKSYFKITSFYINNKIGFTVTSGGDHLGSVDEIELTNNISMKIYLSPLSLFGSYSFIWWDCHLWEFHYNILGIYF
ncbi:MAG: hypothetical protein N2446_01280 [Elusimicrobiales bacterium]|nr:hypothetical protein [Elusimicrobiales bacterium]